MCRCHCVFLLTPCLLVVCRCEWHRNFLLYQWEKERQPARTVTWGLQLTSLLAGINIFQEETISMYWSFVMTGVLKKYGSGFSSQNSHQVISQHQIIIISVEEGNSTIYYCQGTASQGMLHHKFSLWHKPFHRYFCLFILYTDHRAVKQTHQLHTVGDVSPHLF